MNSHSIGARTTDRARRAAARIQQRMGVAGHVLPPYAVNIEPTNRCNSMCTICNRFHERAHEPMGDLELGVIEKLGPVLRAAREVNLSGFGEPLLHPHFLEIVERVVGSTRGRVYFYTNALALDAAMSEALIELGVDRLNVSIGGATEETNLAIRGVPLQPVLDNLIQLKAARKRTGSVFPRVSLEVVGLRRAVRELTGVVDLAVQVGADAIEIPHLSVHDSSLADESLWADPDESERYFRQAVAYGRDVGVSVVPPSMKEHVSSCDLLWSALTVAWDGRVMSCHREAYEVGDLTHSAALEIWNGPRLRQLRSQYARQGASATCAGCSVWDYRAETFVHPPACSRPARHAGLDSGDVG